MIKKRSKSLRILSAHNNYKIRGGEDESCASEEKILRKFGHYVNSFKKCNDSIDTLSNIQLAINTIWSTNTYKTISDTLRSSPYDLVHVQNFFPLISPSIYYAARNQGVPVIQTLRNYRLLCPNALFFRNGQVCEDCIGKFIPYPGVLNNCYRGDRAASSISAAMISVHRMFKTWEKEVNCYIALSNFARNKFIEGGIPANKIIVKPNFVYPDPGVSDGNGNYAIYVGRLSVEKGLDTLLDAWKVLKFSFPLKIVGDGPLAPLVVEATKTNQNIEWLGRKTISEVHELMGNSSFLIFPSKWYETFGRVAVEAFSKGTPVIASNIGAIAELINHGKNGLLFSPGNAEDLSNQIDWCLSNQSKLFEMRKEARNEFITKYTAEANYEILLDVYSQVIDGNI